MDALSPAAVALVRKVLAFYREHDAGPEKKTMLVEMDEHGQDFEEVVREVPSVSVQADEHGVERVALGFDAVVALPEGKDLFAPLPALISLAVARFSEYPSWATVHDPRTVIPFEEIVALWNGDKDAALLAGTLMRGHAPAALSPSFNGPGTSYFLTPSVEVLRYVNVRTLDDVLGIHDYRTRPRPTEEALTQFMHVVFGHMREQDAWPDPVRAAIAWRDLGFVPDLVNALNAATPRIVYQPFGHFPTDRVELLWSVTKLQDGEYWRVRLPAFARALYAAWKDGPGEYKHLGAVAKSADLVVGDAVALAFLTEHEPWARYQTRAEGLKLSEWNICAHETIRHLKECATWDDYVRIRVEKWPGWPDRFGQPPGDERDGTLEEAEGEAAQQPEGLALDDLHPRLLEVAGALARDGHWADALGKALTGLHHYVAEKAGSDAAVDSDDLMGRAFSNKNPVLRLSEHSNEQRGYMLLFQGTFAGLRNPLAHKLVSVSATEGREWLGLVSALYRLVDRAVRVQTPQKTE